MSKSEKIFILHWDFDGVLGNSYIPVLDFANIRLSLAGFSKEIRKEEMTAYDSLFSTVFRETGDQKLATEIRNYWFDPKILSLSPPNLAMVEVFQELEKYPDIRQFINTTRPYECRFCTLNSLNDYFPNIDLSKRLLIRKPFDLMSGSDSKLRYWEEYKVNYIVEDGPIDINNFRKNFPYLRYAKISQNWNSNTIVPNDRQFQSNDSRAIINDILSAKEIHFSSLPFIRTSKPQLAAN